MPDPAINAFWLALSAFAAGVINSLAGGGTLLTFPALLAVLSPLGLAEAAVVANGTSTVALAPGSLAGAWGYRQELRPVRRWLIALTPPSLLGGLLGALLVTRLDPRYFAAVVPWLILTAVLLFIAQPYLTRRPAPTATPTPPPLAHVTALVVFQFVVAVYGGYFGAGIGILMLSALGLMGMNDIHEMNALKTFLAFCVNGISVVIFVIDAKVAWNLVGIMALAAIAGGYFGARLARRVKREYVRYTVIVIGLGLSAYFFWQQWFAG